jgi:hypothetical protein
VLQRDFTAPICSKTVVIKFQAVMEPLFITDSETFMLPVNTHSETKTNCISEYDAWGEAIMKVEGIFWCLLNSLVADF